MKALWSRLRDDVERHEGWADPAVWPLLVHRFGRSCEELPGVLKKVASKVYGATALGVELATGTRLHRETRVGEGLHLIHGRNVCVHPDAVIGARVTLMHDVTIGTGMDDPRVPVLEDDVFVGSGAKILGGVRIGCGARIAANSLVITDIPPGARAMGVPARPFPTRMSAVSRPELAVSRLASR